MTEINKIKDILLSHKGQDISNLYIKYNINQDKNKGRFGHLIEKLVGLNINSNQSPDFDDFELKCIPLKMTKKGILKFKETVAITMINPSNIIDTEFEDSHLYNKLKKVLFVTYIDNTIHGVHIFELKNTIYNTVKEDYDSIKKTIMNDGFNSLSAKMGKYVQPRTKGSGHGSKSRAFYGRVSFLSNIITL